MKNELVESNKCTYIPSIEAEQLYDGSFRGLENIMKYEYIGQIPYSLELKKLRSYSRLFSEKEITTNKIVKYQSDAIINVKFKNKIKDGKQIKSSVRGYDSLMTRLVYEYRNLLRGIRKNKKVIESSKNTRDINKLNKSNNYLQNKADLVKGHFNRIKADSINPIYQEVNAHDLRQYIYSEEGITFKGRKYKFYKRTSSKSRQSQCLMILEDLHDRMKKWSHFGLDLSGEISVSSLLAYESLVSSSIISEIKINPDNIFVIDDQFSTLNNIDAIEVGKDLKAVRNENATITNNIWDGQALIDVSLMEGIGQGKTGMAQLRQAFFKCASFNTSIQQFLKYKCPEGTDFDEWKLKDKFGNLINANKILLITTPSSLKFLRYAKEGKEAQLFNKWKRHVKKESFGICSHEKPSKYGDYSFTSYQMINTLDADIENIKDLAEFEVDYIKQLQGIKNENGEFNEQPFIDYLDQKKDISNAYGMLSDLFEVNPDIVRTQMFRDYRTKQISNYKTKIKGGKIRQLASYNTVVGSPYEMLLSCIGKLKNENGEVLSHTLHGDQIHTKLYDSNVEYTIVRNPHNSANNFHKVVNKDSDLINTYFNFTKNIAVINTISSNIQTIENGMDQDGDTILIFGDTVFNEVVDKTLGNRDHPVIRNKIISKPDPVELNNENIANVDENTAKSQMWIGAVTNQAQYQVSLLADVLQNEKEGKEKQEKVNELLDNISILVVLSNVAIDYSKKVVKVDIDGALRQIRKSDATKVEVDVTKKGKVETKLKQRNKPNFWKYVSTSDVKMEKFHCPMDLLIEHIDKIEKSNYRKNLPLKKLLITLSPEQLSTADDKQINDIIKLIEEFDNKVKGINANDSDSKCSERRESLNSAINKLDEKISKKSIKEATMYKLLLKVSDVYDKKKKGKEVTNELSGITIHLLNTMYRNHKNKLLKLFKK